MFLLEAVKGGRGGVRVEKPLFIYEQDGSYTEELKHLYNPEPH
jgi:tRNA1Val (adenine37-N6)-methyltransferase